MQKHIERPRGLVAHYAFSIFIFIHRSRYYEEFSCNVSVSDYRSMCCLVEH